MKDDDTNISKGTKLMVDKGPLITGISGIRGIIGKSLTEDIIKRFSKAFAAFLPKNARVILARDTRPSGSVFLDVAQKALSMSGCQVYNLGCCPTPTAKLMTCKLHGDGGIIITASHNPSEWNGMKFIRSDGVFLNQFEHNALMELYESDNFFRNSGGNIITIDSSESITEHISRILSNIDVSSLRKSPIKVTVDFCNGTGGLIVKNLFNELGLGKQAHYINDEPNGHFAHDPEPIPSNLEDLGKEVVRNKSAIGFAIDPDADRVTIVDSIGQPVGEDITLAIATKTLTDQKKGPVVTTLSTSQTISDVAIANECDVHLTPVGEVHVVEKMLETHAVIGGEGNGGVVLTQVTPGRDAATGIILILKAITESRQPFEHLLSCLPNYAIQKRKISCDKNIIDVVVEQFLKENPKAHVHPVKDGFKIFVEGKQNCPWLHLRPSNTEPVLRIIAEAQNIYQANEICQKVERTLREKMVNN
jgi:phosphomannomutase